MEVVEGNSLAAVAQGILYGGAKGNASRHVVAAAIAALVRAWKDPQVCCSEEEGYSGGDKPLNALERLLADAGEAAGGVALDIQGLQRLLQGSPALQKGCANSARQGILQPTPMSC